MGKKKQNRAKSRSDSNSTTDVNSNTSPVRPDASFTKCKHIVKGINDGLVKKKLAKVDANELVLCEACPNSEREQNEQGIWFCLNCGHRGCGRNSTHTHSVKHFSASRSTPHPIVMHYPSYNIWCYECDDELDPKKYQKLQISVTQMESKLRYAKRQVDAFSMKELIENELFSVQKPENVVENGITVEETDALAKEKATKTSEIIKDSELVVKGLQNLGNTCFFNSVLQNLVQSHALVRGFRSILPSSNKPVNIIIAPKSLDGEPALTPLKLEIEEGLGRNEFLTSSLLKFFNTYQQKKERYTSPSSVLAEVCRKNPRFRGGRQHDSHELLRCLLDGLRTEELGRLQKAICTELVGQPEPKQSSVDEAMAKNIKAYYAAAPECLVDRVFGGELLQTIKCMQCGHVSQTLEQFLDISLPIVTTQLLKNKKKDEGDSDSDLDQLLANANGVNDKKSKHLAKKQRKDSLKSAKRKSKQISLDDGSEKEEGKKEEEKTEDVEDTTSQSEEIVENGVADSDSAENSDSENSHEEDIADVTEYKKRQEMSLKRLERLQKRGSQDESNRKCTLQSCLALFTTPDLLCGKNKFGCVNCAKIANGESHADSGDSKKDKVVYSDAEKSYLFFSPPVILTIQLKRFQGTGFQTRKLNKEVVFPLKLDLSPFCSKLCQRLISNSVHYELFGFVSHSGGLGGGHYVAYVRARSRDDRRIDMFINQTDNLNRTHRNRLLSQQNAAGLQACEPGNYEDCSEVEKMELPGNWYCISDTNARRISEAEALKAEAYILFYERVI